MLMDKINVAEWFPAKSTSLSRCKEGDLPLLNFSNLTSMTYPCLRCLFECRVTLRINSIRGASPGISYKPRVEDPIGERSWNIATPERKNYDVEIEITTFIINGKGSTVPSD